MRGKILFFLFLTVAVFGSEIKWINNYNDGLKIAQNENKNILLYITSDNCFFCKYMDDKTFQNPSVIEEVNKNFISIKVHKDTNTYPNENFQVVGTPTVFFLDSRGQKNKKTPCWNGK